VIDTDQTVETAHAFGKVGSTAYDGVEIDMGSFTLGMRRKVAAASCV
jgi:hypothetical protein